MIYKTNFFSKVPEPRLAFNEPKAARLFYRTSNTHTAHIGCVNENQNDHLHKSFYQSRKKQKIKQKTKTQQKWSKLYRKYLHKKCYI